MSAAVEQATLCELCLQPTPMSGTKRCDRCYELERRINMDPGLAGKILSMLPASSAKHVDIVFDGPPGHESGRFVEVEDETGKSIQFGEWVKRADGFWALRIAGRSA